MNKTMTLAIAAVATSLAAGPVLAKDANQNESARQTMKTQKIKVSQARQQMRQQQDANATYERGFNNGFDRRAQFDRGYDRTTTTYVDRGYDTGFWPADVAADAVADTVTTADAIATAPFRNTYAYDDSYDYATAPVYRSSSDNGWNSGWNNGYANTSWNNGWNNNWARRQSVQEGGFACTPGTYYTNSYGYSQLCQ